MMIHSQILSDNRDYIASCNVAGNRTLYKDNTGHINMLHSNFSKDFVLNEYNIISIDSLPPGQR